MEKIYLLVGESTYLIREQIKKYQVISKIDPMNVVTLDATETPLENILQELYTVSFFDEQKMVIIENVDALSQYDMKELKDFQKYLENPSSEIILIMYVTKLPERSAFTDLLEKYTFIEQIKPIEGSLLPIHIKKIFDEDGYKIDGRTIQAIIDRTGNNLYLIEQEIEKLKAYAHDTKEISYLIVDELVPRTLEENIFNFSKAYLQGDVRSYIQMYDDLLESKMQASTIINHLYQTVYLIYQAQKLLKSGYDQESISHYLGITSGRAYHVVKEAKVQSPKALEALIKDLSNLDLDIKSGNQDDKLGFELLLLRKVK